MTWGRTGFLRPHRACFHRRGVVAQLQARGVAVPRPGALLQAGHVQLVPRWNMELGASPGG